MHTHNADLKAVIDIAENGKHRNIYQHDDIVAVARKQSGGIKVLPHADKGRCDRYDDQYFKKEQNGVTEFHQQTHTVTAFRKIYVHSYFTTIRHKSQQAALAKAFKPCRFVNDVLQN